MRAFHGSSLNIIKHTDNFTLTPSTNGSFGTGIYLADQNAAHEYAGECEGGLVFEFEVDTSDFARIEVGFEVAEKYDLDTAALPLIMAMFSIDEAQAAKWFKAHTTDGFLLGGEIQQCAIELGYKGLILDYGDCFELLAFDGDALTKIGEEAV